MIAYDKRGAVFAMNDGAEVLAHDGESEGPLWRKTLDAAIVGLGADSEQIVATTASGAVTWFTAGNGEVRGNASLGAPVTAALADMAKRRVVGLAADRIVALDGDAVTTLASHGARAIAMRPDGTVLAATDTELVLLAPDGARTAEPYSGPPIHALAWHPEGFWVLGASPKLLRWTGSGPLAHITRLPGEAKIDHLACCDRAIAIAFDKHTVVEMAWPAKATLGSLTYADRKVRGLDFGPWPWLGIALDLGDGNKHNVIDTDRLNRSDTHPGRKHNSWLVAVGGGAQDKAPAAPAPAAAKVASPAMRLVGLVVAVVVGIAVFYLMRR